VDYTTFVKEIRNLPTPSPVLMRIENVLKNPESTASQVADVIRLDPAITSKVLRLANSAYVGVVRTVTSLQNAVVLLGSKRVHSIVLASELLNAVTIRQSGGFRLDLYWLHSVTTALIAEGIAGYVQKGELLDTSEVFVAALLHDIGKMVLAKLMPDAISAAALRAQESKTPYWKNEEPEVHHTVTGKYLSEHWSFPSLLTDCICKHHQPETSAESALVVSIIHISDVTAHMIGRSVTEHEVAPEISPFALSKVALSPEQFKVIATKAIEDRKRVDSLLEMFNVSPAV